ncbi:methylmalonyl-CoA mutase family protein [Aminobacter sp. J41]|uniref:methylmalonyl-CoA mutase family protein n=1 Tax=Aminobacter sp. J41 TaxID=935261 RepID=UPI0004678ABE|nr:methylmalonyl-CoA mutase family protein [Aminobacter sp. J41]
MEAAIISAGSFPPMNRADWLEIGRQAVIKRRADAPQPPRSADLRFQQPRLDVGAAAMEGNAGAGWTIVQRIDDVDPRRANHQAQEDIAGGATGLSIVFEGAPNAFGYGLPARPESLAAVLHNIQLNRIHLRMDMHPASRASVDWLIELARRKKVDPARLSLSFGIDPAALFAGSGTLRMSVAALQASMPPSLGHFFGLGIPAVLLEADGRVVHNAGGSEAQELGVMLSAAVSYLRMFIDARQPLVYAAPHIGFSLSVDHDQFISVAKIRALRRLWSKVQEICNIPALPPKIHAETSYRMMSVRSVETNIVRASLAASAAAAAGADTVSVLPHTQPHGLPDAHARRIARDLQLVIADETHLSSLADPAASSEDLDILVASLCDAGWEEFRRIQEEGGLLTSLAAGFVQQRVFQAREQRLLALRKGSFSIVGTTIDQPKEDVAPATLAATARPGPTEGVARCDRLAPVRFDELLAQG